MRCLPTAISPEHVSEQRDVVDRSHGKMVCARVNRDCRAKQRHRLQLNRNWLEPFHRHDSVDHVDEGHESKASP